MKKYFFLIHLLFSVFAFYPYIPFNCEFDTNCTYEMIDKGLKGTIQMFKQAKDKNNQPIKNTFTLVLNDYFSNAKMELNSALIRIYDNNWNPTRYTLKEPQTWVTWDRQDEKEERLFRYFIFYDVMGIMEEKFRKLSSKCKTKYVNPEAKHVLRSEALGKKEDFSLKTIGDLEEQFKIYKKNNNPAQKPGSTSILNFYEIWQKEGLMKAFEKTDIRALQGKIQVHGFNLLQILIV